MYADIRRTDAAAQTYDRGNLGNARIGNRIRSFKRRARHVAPCHDTAYPRPGQKRRKQHVGNLAVFVLRSQRFHQMRQRKSRFPYACKRPAPPGGIKGRIPSLPEAKSMIHDLHARFSPIQAAYVMKALEPYTAHPPSYDGDFNITGDGGFRMNCNELATVQYYGLPIVSVIFNNGTLGMVRQWQSLIYGKRYSETTLDRGPDFVKLAEAYGLRGFRVRTRAEMEAALEAALSGGTGAVIDCMLDIDEMVRPMVAAGSPITDFLLN